VSSEELGVVEVNGVRRHGPEGGVDRLAALGCALSDPIRVSMLGMMADGRGCCDWFRDGKAVAHWGVRDDLGMMQQMSVIPEPGQPGEPDPT
jgi:hypothetical protein